MDYRDVNVSVMVLYGCRHIFEHGWEFKNRLALLPNDLVKGYNFVCLNEYFLFKESVEWVKDKGVRWIVLHDAHVWCEGKFFEQFEEHFVGTFEFNFKLLLSVTKLSIL